MKRTLITVYSTDRDLVIDSVVALGATNYRIALDHLHPLLDRFGEQRKIQSRSFYARLKSDLVKGCIMPPITLAFVSKENSKGVSPKEAEKFISENISDGYILDGMQRLNTLKEAAESSELDLDRPLHVNVILAARYDLLLYRMITLNNGQKPMTARHQIEMLTKGAIDLSNFALPVVSEKETEGTKVHGAFKLSDIVEAYTAYLTDNVNNQNKRIIESKLDEILVGRVMDSELPDAKVSFSEILSEVERLSEDPTSREWFRQTNNLIGFTVGAKKSFGNLLSISKDEYGELINKFQQAFDAINPSKVNVGKSRRELCAKMIENVEDYLHGDVSDLESAFFDLTLSE